MAPIDWESVGTETVSEPSKQSSGSIDWESIGTETAAEPVAQTPSSVKTSSPAELINWNTLSEPKANGVLDKITKVGKEGVDFLKKGKDEILQNPAGSLVNAGKGFASAYGQTIDMLTRHVTDNLYGFQSNATGDAYLNSSKQLETQLKGIDFNQYNQRYDLQNKIKASLELLKSPNMDPSGRVEIQKQVDDMSLQISGLTIDNDKYKKFTEYKDLEKKGKLYKAIGTNIQKNHIKIANRFTTDRERDTFAYALGNGIGQISQQVGIVKGLQAVGFAAKAASWVAAVPVSLPAATDMYDKAIQSGLPPEKARIAGLTNFVTNVALEKVGLDSLLAPGTKSVFKGIAKGMATEGLQEGTQQILGENLVTKTFIDNNQDLLEGVAENTIIGAIIGGGMGGLNVHTENQLDIELKNKIKEKLVAKDEVPQEQLNAFVDKYVDSLKEKVTQAKDFLNDKVLNPDFKKLVKDFGKEQPTDGVPDKATADIAIGGQINFNNPEHIQAEIVNINKIIKQTESTMSAETASTILAPLMEKRTELTRKYTEIVNKPGMELVPGELGEIRAEIKETTGAEISIEQAAEIFREKQFAMREQLFKEDKKAIGTGKTNVTGQGQFDTDRTVTGIPSERRPELQNVKRMSEKGNNVYTQAVTELADKNLTDGYSEMGEFIPGDSEYTLAKAKISNDPKLYKKVVENAEKEIAYITKDYGSVENMESIIKEIEDNPLQLEISEENKNDAKEIKNILQDVRRINSRVEEAKGRINKPNEKAKRTDAAKTPKADVNSEPKESPVNYFKGSDEVTRGGEGAKRVAPHTIGALITELKLNTSIKELPANILGKADYANYRVTFAKALFEGKYPAITAENIGLVEYELLKAANVIDQNGIVDSRFSLGKLGVLKEALALEADKRGLNDAFIESLNEKLAGLKQFNDASEVMAHEAGHIMDANPDYKPVPKSSVLMKALAAISNREVQLSGEITNDSSLRKELIALTEWWHPYDKSKVKKDYVRYRNTASELYAEFVSVYMNDRDQALKRAPEFTRLFEKYINKKPEIKTALENFRKFENMTSEELGKYHTQRIRDMQIDSEEYTAKSQEEPVRSIKDKILDFGDSFIKNGYMYNLHTIKLLVKKGELKNIFDIKGTTKSDSFFGLNSLKIWNNMPYVLRDAYLSIFYQEVGSGKNKKIINNTHHLKAGSDFNVHMYNQRVIHDRNGLANYEGYTAADAIKSENEIKQRIGEKEYKVLKDFGEKYYEFMKKEIVDKQFAYGLISENHRNNIIKNNMKYAYNDVVDLLADVDQQAMGGDLKGAENKLTSLMKNQKGSLKATRAPALATIDLVTKMGFMMEVNKYKLAFEDFLYEKIGEEKFNPAFVEAKRGPVGLKEPPQGFKRFTVIRDSEFKAYDVRDDWFNEYDSALSALENVPDAIKALRPVSSFIRSLRTKYNIGFAKNELTRSLDNLQSVMTSAAIPGTEKLFNIKDGGYIKDYKRLWPSLKVGLGAAYEMLNSPIYQSELVKTAIATGAVSPLGVQFEVDEFKTRRTADGKTEVYREYLKSNAQKILDSKFNKPGFKLEGLNIAEMKNAKEATLAIAKAIIRNSKKGTVTYAKGIEYANEFIDKTVKMTAFNFLTTELKMDPKDAAIYVKRLIGNPDNTYGGIGRGTLGILLEFFNPTANGFTRQMNLLTNGNLGKGLKTFARKKVMRLLTNPVIVIGTIIPWLHVNFGDDDDEYKNISKDQLKKNVMIPFLNKLGLAKDQGTQFTHQLVTKFLDMSYSLAKLKGGDATGDMMAMIGSIFENMGLSLDTLNSLVKTSYDFSVNNDRNGNPIYEKFAAPDILIDKFIGYSYNNLLGSAVPKLKTLSPFKESAGITERIQRENKQTLQLNAHIRSKVNDYLFHGGNVSLEKLYKMAGNDTSALKIVIKAQAIGKEKKGLVETLKKDQRLSQYARAINDVIGGKYTDEVKINSLEKIMSRARRDFKGQPDRYQKIFEYRGFMNAN